MPQVDRNARVDWWVRGTFFTAWVETDLHGRITDTAPVLKRFQGQQFSRLLDWTATRESKKLNVRR